LVAITNQQEVVEMYFDNDKSIAVTKDMFEHSVGEIDTVELPATLFVSHFGTSASTGMQKFQHEIVCTQNGPIFKFSPYAI